LSKAPLLGVGEPPYILVDPILGVTIDKHINFYVFSGSSNDCRGRRMASRVEQC